jgi:hypothetical protein
MPLHILKRAIDIFIILYLVIEMGYVTYQVFFIWSLKGSTFAPLMGESLNVKPEVLLARRLYAIEGYLAAIALILYLAVRERIWKFKPLNS